MVERRSGRSRGATMGLYSMCGLRPSSHCGGAEVSVCYCTVSWHARCVGGGCVALHFVSCCFDIRFSFGRIRRSRLYSLRCNMGEFSLAHLCRGIQSG